MTSIASDIKSVIAALDDATLTAEGFVKRVLKEIAALTIPDSQVAAMKAELATFEKHAQPQS
jgi:hypothetical protein